MATIQQSIDIKVPVRTIYNQLTQFEEYPQFMEEVKTVQQLDDTHLHWTTMMANRPVEWDAEITEQEPDRCIAWRNVSGPTNSGKVEVQPLGPDAARVTLTMQSEPQQVPGSMAGNTEQEMAQRLKFDLARLKDFIEARGSETGSWRGEIHDAKVTLRDRDAKGQPAQGSAQQAASVADTQAGRGSPRNSPVPTSSYAAGSEGFSGTEEPDAPVTSASHTAAEQWNDSAGSVRQAQPSSAQPPGPTRHVGQMPQDTSMETRSGSPASDAMAAPRQQEQQGSLGAQTQQATGRAVPASSEPGKAQQSASGRPAERGTGVGGTAAVVGAAGGTDASAGARMAGSKGAAGSTGMPEEAKGGIAGGGASPAAGASASGSSLGGADIGADACDTRAVPREGTTPAAGGTGGKGSTKP